MLANVRLRLRTLNLSVPELETAAPRQPETPQPPAPGHPFQDEIRAALVHGALAPLAGVEALMLRLRGAIAHEIEEAQPVLEEAVRQTKLSLENVLELMRTGAALRERLDLRRLLDEALRLYEPAARASGRQLTSLPSGPALLDGDRAMLRRMLAQLVSESMMRAPEGGRIELRLGPTPSGEVRLSIAGMAAATSRTMEKSLAPVRRCVELHHGKCGWEGPASAPLFAVTLPAQSA